MAEAPHSPGGRKEQGSVAQETLQMHGRVPRETAPAPTAIKSKYGAAQKLFLFCDSFVGSTIQNILLKMQATSNTAPLSICQRQ